MRLMDISLWIENINTIKKNWMQQELLNKYIKEFGSSIGECKGGVERMNYYISDMHLGHKNALVFEERPFETVGEMNETLIRNWNAKVNDDCKYYEVFYILFHTELRIL